MTDVIMRQGNLRPFLDVTLSDVSGPVDLSGETVRFVMRSTDNTMTADQTSTGAQVVILATGTSGGVRYKWLDTDTVTPGSFLGEFEMYPTGSSSEFMTFPNSGHIEIVVTPELST